MLQFPLIHPEILAALGGAGHGSHVLVADANFAHRTGTNPAAPVVYLNLRPGLVTVEQVLQTLVPACPFERAVVMAPDDGTASPVSERYAELLGLTVGSLARDDFYAACLDRTVALTVATGDDRFYANVLLTIGAVTPQS